ncbi:hypothetical protein ART_2591 [Arthrobacter sp. PAMC 25486]|uniref:DUF4190 domain-containing protein n=1 Tax=Arthrobacter sp. PAMC 25486 TaxID=1494608 RepID=UPI000536344B|nr:DUF4190 domain-containing protein [Arthrobacter sp. PAMC 25486]AIY02190.1 hypothetical protein ART_2591 [Arthrobacter sp. PAMC 25486]
MTNYPQQPGPVQYYGAPTHFQGGTGYAEKSAGPQGLSLASMILGLSSLLFLGWLMLPQIAGIVLGHMGLRKEAPQGQSFAVTGLVTNYLALVIWGALWAFGLFFFAAIMGILEGEFTTYA